MAARRVGIHQDLDQADDLLVDDQRGDDQRERGRVAGVAAPPRSPRPGGMICGCEAWIMQPEQGVVRVAS